MPAFSRFISYQFLLPHFTFWITVAFWILLGVHWICHDILCLYAFAHYSLLWEGCFFLSNCYSFLKVSPLDVFSNFPSSLPWSLGVLKLCSDKILYTLHSIYYRVLQLCTSVVPVWLQFLEEIFLKEELNTLVKGTGFTFISEFESHFSLIPALWLY